MSDPWEHPEARKCLRRAFKELLPKMQRSTVTFSLVPRGPSDMKYAVELGLSIMLDKPIYLIVHPGQKIPAKLMAVADDVLEGDLSTEEGARSLAKRIGEIGDQHREEP